MDAHRKKREERKHTWQQNKKRGKRRGVSLGREQRTDWIAAVDTRQQTTTKDDDMAWRERESLTSGSWWMMIK